MRNEEDLNALLRRRLAAVAGRSSDFDLNPGLRPVSGPVLRPAAVLVPVIGDSPGSARVILTKRASHLQHHPGQVSFPGGKVEADDASPEAAALREAEEEIGLSAGLVTILGQLPPHETVTGFSVTPVLARVAPGFVAQPEAGEVEEVFTVPLAHLLSAESYSIERRRWQGQWRHYYTVPWGPYYIWGATARMLRGLAEG